MCDAVCVCCVCGGLSVLGFGCCVVVACIVCVCCFIVGCVLVCS